jgi:hypothetical protein
MGGRRGDPQLWNRCRRTVERLDLPDPFEAEAFITALARERGRPIELVPVSGRPHLPCGLVVTTDQGDLILYSADTTALHRQHILLHEAAHLVCGHCDGPPGGSQTAAAETLMPHLPAGLVRDVLGRTVYSEPQEREAELVASLILYRIGSSRRGRAPARAEAPRTRLEALFGIPES